MNELTKIKNYFLSHILLWKDTRCRYCKQDINQNELHSLFCNKCFNMISYASTTLHKKKYPIYSLGKYDGILRFITTEKYKRQILSLHGIQAKIKQLFLLYNIEFDTVIYIPKKVFNAISHRYNPSYEIALFLARHYQKEIFDELFYRYHGTSQSGKTTKDRLLLDTNQFIIPFSSYKKLKNKNVLIIDDVYTTGSTIDAIIKNIEKCEVKSISIFVIAKN